MMRTITILVALFALFATNSYAQNKEEDPPEVQARKKTEQLVRSLKLSDAQEFYVDSILTSNYVGYKKAIDDLMKAGMLENEIYKQTTDLWREKRLEALKGVLDEQQYIKYLRSLGLGKEYKKGKDGKYYLKSELKKK